MSKIFALFGLILGCGLLLSGCASPAQPSAMVPSPIAPSSHHATGNLNIAVSGGRETSSVGASQISNADFGSALVQSIEQTQIFAQVGLGASGRYQLNAYISKMSQPLFGLSMTVSMEVGYTLIDNQTGKTIWQKDIASEHTAAMSDAFAGVKRLRLANEGAAKQNIDSLLHQLAQIQW